jgi:predicted DCC family thiol-disulfide oxidoreductase YuxK
MSIEYAPKAARLTVLYDADCGFCARCATVVARLDRRGALRFAPLQAPPTDVGEPPTVSELLGEMHVTEGPGKWTRGAAAWLQIFAAVPVLRPLALAGRNPLGRWAVERLHALVARNRHRLSGLLGVDGCAYRPPRR